MSVDFRLYRLAFLPVALALVALMFSLRGTPEPLEPVGPPPSFEVERALATAEEIVREAPDREPGSQGDGEIADLVGDRFASIRTGALSEQLIRASIDGESVGLRNVFVTLAGDSPASVVVLAARDKLGGPGSASSAAATATLIELARALGVTGHAKTYVLASTSAGTAGALGARRLIGALPNPDSVVAVLVISQPALSEPKAPYVVSTSTRPGTSGAQLTATAAAAVRSRTGLEDEQPGGLAQLARLAIPSGLGEQAPLIAAGIDAIRISSAGERPLSPPEGDPEEISAETLGDFGRAAAAVVQALDASPHPPRRGPQPYLAIGGNIVPGWTLALLALTLLLPATVAATDAAVRVARRSGTLAGGAIWALSRTLPPLAALIALYALAIVGLVPRPPFPFDPGRYGVGVAAILAIGMIAAAAGAAAWGVGRARLHAHELSPGSVVAGLGALSVVAGALAWLANPYLGLLISPAAHAWLALAVGAGRLRAATLAVASLVPLALALGHVASVLELGAAAPWTFAVMTADGQIPFTVAVSLCLLAGALAGTVSAPRNRLAGR